MTARVKRFDLRQMRAPVLAVLAVWAALNVGFYLLATRPMVQRYDALVVGTEPQRQELAVQRKAVEEREAYLAKLEQARHDLETIRDEVLSTRERRLIDVQLEVERLCQEVGIDFDSVNFDNEMLERTELDRHVMVVPLQGNYVNLRRFLQGVEQSDKFLVVERVALAEGKQGGVLLELQITLATYFNAPESMRRGVERSSPVAPTERRG